MRRQRRGNDGALAVAAPNTKAVLCNKTRNATCARLLCHVLLNTKAQLLCNATAHGGNDGALAVAAPNTKAVLCNKHGMPLVPACYAMCC